MYTIWLCCFYIEEIIYVVMLLQVATSYIQILKWGNFIVGTTLQHNPSFSSAPLLPTPGSYIAQPASFKTGFVIFNIYSTNLLDIL